MQSSSQSAIVSAQASARAIEFTSANEDWAYQAATVAAILLVLASLWVF
jgi:hypothetical protein